MHAQVNEIHMAASLQTQRVMQRLQGTMDFLIENECPRHLRTQIIQWTRFHMEHQDTNVQKKHMISALPADHQRDLVRHLYGRQVSRVPVFAYLEAIDDDKRFSDEVQEEFLNEIFLQFEYRTLSPGQVLTNFSAGSTSINLISTSINLISTLYQPHIKLPLPRAGPHQLLRPGGPFHLHRQRAAGRGVRASGGAPPACRV